ncbi:MAG: hypothetical protein MUC34_00075 [Anaerolineae bacterium]|jgi:hypothetical protein|nr:hypothetical protein [Anaerolineae bacterium]
MYLRKVVAAVALALTSTLAAGQAGVKPSGPPPGHDMNEQNMNAPGMRETMRRQQGEVAPGTKPAPVRGHDMNEQNEHAPGMHERMRRESATGGRAPATASSPGNKSGARVVDSNKERATGRYHEADKHNP